MKKWALILAIATAFPAVIMAREGQDTLPLARPDTVFNRTLDEAVVSGIIRGSSVRESPVPVVRVSTRQIDLATESNLIDVLVRNVPGMQAVKTGPNISKPFIRGLGYHRVLTMFDGLRQEGQQWGDEHGIEVDAYAIDRAEVIKGPASLMYGSDALAGVVSLFPMVPKQGDGKLHGRTIAEYQTNNGLLGGGLSLEQAREHVYYSLRGSARLAKNYRNALDGRVYQSSFFEKNLTAMLGYRKPGLDLRFNYTLYDDLQAIPDGSRDSLTRRFTKQVFEGDADTITRRPLVTDEELNAYRPSDLSQRIRHQRAYLRAEHALGAGELEWTLGWQGNDRAEYVHPTQPRSPGMHMRLQTINYGLRYDVPVADQWQFAAGFNGMWQQNRNLDATDFPIPDHTLFDLGAFLHAKWTLGDLVLTGGIRQDMRKDKWNDLYVRKDPGTGFDQRVYPPDTSGADHRYEAFGRDFSGTSASLGLSWRVSAHVTLKANVGRAYRAPHITELASNGLDPGAHIVYKGDRDFAPEFSWQEDVGMNLRFEGFTADVSLFNLNVRNYIYQALVVDAAGIPVSDAQGNRTYAYRQEAAQLYGAEWWSVVHPPMMHGLRFENSLSFVRGYNRGEGSRGKGIQGEYLPFIPPFKWWSSLSQPFRTGPEKRMAITPRVDMEYTGRQDRFLALHGTETATPAYVLLHVGVTVDMRARNGRTVQVQLQVNNLFDEVYQSHLSRLKYFEYYQASPNGRSGIYNMGRNACVKVVVGW